ncbi:MAG: hypothetical protein HQL27_06970 [Candidatus Omnitrophica bacterium]|nr:hypothetical protein [Candidatus Omnitrophota bacterium]
MKRFFCFILVISLIGCSFFKPVKATDAGNASPHNFKGTVLDFSRLTLGGKILILPFNPGEAVGADEDYDKVSLMIIRGFYDILGDGPGKPDNNNTGLLFDVIFDEEDNNAGMVLDGRITAIKKTAKNSMIFIGKSVTFEVSAEGSLTDKSSGRKIAVFEDKKSLNAKDGDYGVLGRQIGRDIGKFLVESLNVPKERD